MAKQKAEQTAEKDTLSSSAGDYHLLQAAFDEAASNWDLMIQSSTLLSQVRAENLERLEQVFPPGAWVLDIGCGTGDEALHLASRGCKVWGIDVSPHMIAIAKEKALKRSLSEQTRFQVLPAGQVVRLLDEIPAERLTGAWSSLGAINLEPDLSGLREGLGRLLKPSGRLVLQAFNIRSSFEKLFGLSHFKPSMGSRRGGKAPGIELLSGPLADAASTHFWAPQALADAFKPHFSVDKVLACHPFGPSLHFHDRYDRHGGLYAQLQRLSSTLVSSPSVVQGSDLYVLMMMRESLELGGMPHGPHWLANG